MAPEALPLVNVTVPPELLLPEELDEDAPLVDEVVDDDEDAPLVDEVVDDVDEAVPLLDDEAVPLLDDEAPLVDEDELEELPPLPPELELHAAVATTAPRQVTTQPSARLET
jgi:hypothetical protein